MTIEIVDDLYNNVRFAKNFLIQEINNVCKELADKLVI
jgi:hypothetical protein